MDGECFDDEVFERLQKIEQSIFRNIVKEVEQELGEDWGGSKEQNQVGDLKVAQSVKRSFKTYETSRKKKSEKKYFKF